MFRILALLIVASTAQAQFTVSPPPPPLEKRVSDLEYRVANLEKMVGVPKTMPMTLVSPPPVEYPPAATVYYTYSAVSSAAPVVYTTSDGYTCVNGQCSRTSGATAMYSKTYQSSGTGTGRPILDFITGRSR